MSEPEGVSARTTLAILLGAAEWPHAPALSGGPAYGNSASAFREYLSTQFGLSDLNILYLFDDPRAPSDLDEQISRFLRNRTETLRTAGTPALDLIFYYVGHGGFVNQDYYLAVRTTREGAEGVSGLRMADVARTILREARNLRRYLILDCCFAAAAYEEFMAAPADVAKRRTLDQFPTHGTALLCASGARDPARAPRDSRFTVFSDAMLSVLRTGKKNEDPRLSLKDVGDETLELVKEAWPDDLTRPQVLSPDVSDGDVALVRLFPNAANLPADLRFEAVNDQVAELTRSVRLLETKVATLETDRIAAAPPAVESVPKEPDTTMVAAPRTREHFYLADAQWNQIPFAARTWLHGCRRADLMGWFWMALATLLLIAVGFMMLTKAPTAAWVWSMGIVLASSIVLTIIGFARTMMREKRGETDAPPIPAASTQPWHNLEIIARYATHKSFKIVGGLFVSSPFFEIAAILFVVSATVLGFLVYTLAPP